MKLLGSVLIFAMAACVATPADPPPSPSQPALDDPSTASADVSASESALEAATQAAPTFHFQFREECVNWFYGPCFATYPAPQCPSAPEGKACTLDQPFCYKTITRNFFDYYECY